MLFSSEKINHIVDFKRLIFVAALLLVSVCGFSRETSAATLSISPVSGASSYSVGQLFSVGVYVSTPSNQPMNAVSGTLVFNPALVQLVSVEKTGSIIDFWIGDSSFSNTEGRANFEGGAYNPGYAGTNGKVISFLFRAKAKGSAGFSLASASVLANDGSGTSILERSGTATVNIVQAVKEPVSAVPSIPIRSSSHPSQDTWYTTKTVSLDWDVPASATGVRTGLSKGANDLPTVIATPPISNTTVTVEDGTWYFHLQGRDASGWGPATHYKIQVDTAPRTPPKFDDFSRTILEGEPIRISGTTYPNSTVFIYVEDSSGNESSQETRSTADGKFDVVWGKRLANGSYNVSAMVTDNRKLSSPRSSDLPITIQAKALERVGWPLLNFATLFFIIALVIALCIAWSWYLYHRIRNFRRKVRWDVRETDARIREKFKKLETYITDHVRLLQQEETKRSLTPQEEKLIINIKDLLHDADESIESDVDRIGKF
jgi:hypothetical protein